eukprot:c40542_g1_i1.p1 GENE.c40542_g1_i1~~c40542_g1_i1.p1  ORF type:complete len:621 (-),score=88.50 c40542_g1_i1:42-1904(-)
MNGFRSAELGASTPFSFLEKGGQSSGITRSGREPRSYSAASSHAHTPSPAPRDLDTPASYTSASYASTSGASGTQHTSYYGSELSKSALSSRQSHISSRSGGTPSTSYTGRTPTPQSHSSWVSTDTEVQELVHTLQKTKAEKNRVIVDLQVLHKEMQRIEVELVMNAQAQRKAQMTPEYLPENSTDVRMLRREITRLEGEIKPLREENDHLKELNGRLSQEVLLLRNSNPQVAEIYSSHTQKKQLTSMLLSQEVTDLVDDVNSMNNHTRESNDALAAVLANMIAEVKLGLKSDQDATAARNECTKLRRKLARLQARGGSTPTTATSGAASPYDLDEKLRALTELANHYPHDNSSKPKPRIVPRDDDDNDSVGSCDLTGFGLAGSDTEEDSQKPNPDSGSLSGPVMHALTKLRGHVDVGDMQSKYRFGYLSSQALAIIEKLSTALHKDVDKAVELSANNEHVSSSFKANTRQMLESTQHLVEKCRQSQAVLAQVVPDMFPILDVQAIVLAERERTQQLGVALERESSFLMTGGETQKLSEEYCRASDELSQSFNRVLGAVTVLLSVLVNSVVATTAEVKQSEMELQVEINARLQIQAESQRKLQSIQDTLRTIAITMGHNS